MALKQGLSIANTPGLIDAHYRGELKIIAVNLDPDHVIHIERGERIAQLVIQRVPVVELLEVDCELDRYRSRTLRIRFQRHGMIRAENIMRTLRELYF